MNRTLNNHLQIRLFFIESILIDLFRLLLAIVADAKSTKSSNSRMTSRESGKITGLIIVAIHPLLKLFARNDHG